jgi:hypothetical protein
VEVIQSIPSSPGHAAGIEGWAESPRERDKQSNPMEDSDNYRPQLGVIFEDKMNLVLELTLKLWHASMPPMQAARDRHPGIGSELLGIVSLYIVRWGGSKRKS